jgi:hypothetical protein
VLTNALAVLLEGLLLAGCGRAQTLAATAAGPGAPVRQPQQVTLDATEPSGLGRSRWPLTAGVPFPPGTVKDASELGISAAAGNTAHAPLMTQSRVLSRWPDGSVRWALMDWQTDLQPRQSRRFVIVPGKPEMSPAAPGRPVPGARVTVEDREGGVAVDTGPLQFVVPKMRFSVLDQVRVDGKAVTSAPVVAFMNIGDKRVDGQAPATVTVTERGPLRARIELRGHYTAAFDYVLRIDAFANQSFVRVLHSFEQRSPEAYTVVRQIGIEVPLRLGTKAAYRAGRKSGAPFAGPLSADGFTLYQEDNETLHAAGNRQLGRAAGWADVHDPAHGVALASRFFWQEYPQSIYLRPSGLTYNLWAPEAAPAKIGMGAAKTHEMFFYFYGAAPPAGDLLAALARPLPVRVDPQWTAATGALRNSVAPTSSNAVFFRELKAAYQRYEVHAEQEPWESSGEVKCPDPATGQPRRGFFGMLNWGDWNFPGYHDTTKGCDAWGNLEYDMTQVLALAYTATGEPAYYEGMVVAARHFMDVDSIHYQSQHPNWVGMNHPKNPLHFAFELGGVDLGHTWTEGLLSYYYLTGDERGLDAARGIADYLVARLRAGVARGNPRQWGWPQIALVAAYEATGNETYKSAALEYARKGMAAHRADDVSHWKMGILADALCYTHAMTQDAAIGDWLRRYAAAAHRRPAGADARFMPAVAYVGRLTAQLEYTEAAALTVSRLTFGNWGKPFTIAGRLGFRLLSLTAGQKAPQGGPPVSQ